MEKIKYYIWILMLLTVSVIFSGCQKQTGQKNKEEHKEKSIRGSVCIPLDEVEQRLTEEYPDMGQMLIFYCSKGIRSQSAAETARKLGYVEVYRLGSIDNWKYETE